MDETPGRISVLYVRSESASGAAAAVEQSRDQLTVETATTAEAGLEAVAEEQYDCVVSSYKLPSENGVAFLRDVRTLDSNLPVILYPSAGSEEIASEAIGAGVTDYLPDDPGTGVDELVDRIVEAVDPTRIGCERRHLQDAAETAGVGIAVLTAAGEYRHVTDAYADIYGYDPEALIGQHRDVVSQDGRSFEDDVRPRLRADGEFSREGVGIRADGTSVPVHVTVSSIDTGGFICTSRDISVQWERQATLERESSLLDTIFDQVPAHLFIKDTAARHVRVSKHFVDQRTLDSSTLLVDAFDREHIIGKTDREIARNEHTRASFADDRSVIETGEPILNKQEYVPGEDEWNLTSKVPWRGPDGDIRGLIGISRRITEQKRTEVELQRQNERLAEFANLVSHDLRNPLQTARGRLEVVQREHESEQFEVIDRAHERMAELIETLLTLASMGEERTEAEPVDLARLVERCWEHLGLDGATLEVETEQWITADRSRLKQLLENLLKNAADHADEAVTITVGDIDGGFYVEDDGPGIPQADRDAVFQNGFTTASDGTGFGLRIVERVVSAHDWQVTATAGSEGGARFEITNVALADR